MTEYLPKIGEKYYYIHREVIVIAVIQAEQSLKVVTCDLRNNKDAATLQSMGSTIGCQTSRNICPTCNQPIEDSLLHLGKDISIMIIEENIRHLEGQKSVLEFTQDSHNI